MVEPCAEHEQLKATTAVLDDMKRHEAGLVQAEKSFQVRFHQRCSVVTSSRELISPSAQA
jgi:hypothetical protein